MTERIQSEGLELPLELQADTCFELSCTVSARLHISVVSLVCVRACERACVCLCVLLHACKYMYAYSVHGYKGCCESITGIGLLECPVQYTSTAS